VLGSADAEEARRRASSSTKRLHFTAVKHTAFLVAAASILGGITFLPNSTRAASAAQIDQSARAALNSLYASSPDAQTVGKQAKAVLVFPRILKGGFLVAAQYGDGALIVKGKTVAHYNTIAGSYGLQVGVQKFGYALFYMHSSL